MARGAGTPVADELWDDMPVILTTARRQVGDDDPEGQSVVCPGPGKGDLPASRLWRPTGELVGTPKWTTCAILVPVPGETPRSVAVRPYRVFTTGQAAELLGVDVRSVRRLAERRADAGSPVSWDPKDPLNPMPCQLYEAGWVIERARDRGVSGEFPEPSTIHLPALPDLVPVGADSSGSELHFRLAAAEADSARKDAELTEQRISLLEDQARRADLEAARWRDEAQRWKAVAASTATVLAQTAAPEIAGHPS